MYINLLMYIQKGVCEIVRRDASFLKTQRLNEISKKMASSFAQSEKLELKKLINWIQYNIGLTYDRTLEYINLVCAVHNWKIEGEFVVKNPE